MFEIQAKSKIFHVLCDYKASREKYAQSSAFSHILRAFTYSDLSNESLIYYLDALWKAGIDKNTIYTRYRIFRAIVKYYAHPLLVGEAYTAAFSLPYKLRSRYFPLSTAEKVRVKPDKLQIYIDFSAEFNRWLELTDF